MATPANTSQQALCQLVPVYSTEQAECVRANIHLMARAAKWTGCSQIMFEFIPATAAAVQQILGPIRFKDVELYSRIRNLEEGFVMWAPPLPPDRAPSPPREVKVYEPQKPKPPPGAVAYESEGAEEIDTSEDIEGVDTPLPPPQEEEPKPPSTPPANPKRARTRAQAAAAARPKPLMRQGVKLDPQQPAGDPDEDLVGGGKITKIKPRPQKGS